MIKKIVLSNIVCLFIYGCSPKVINNIDLSNFQNVTPSDYLLISHIGESDKSFDKIFISMDSTMNIKEFFARGILIESFEYNYLLKSIEENKNCIDIVSDSLYSYGSFKYTVYEDGQPVSTCGIINKQQNFTFLLHNLQDIKRNKELIDQLKHINKRLNF